MTAYLAVLLLELGCAAAGYYYGRELEKLAQRRRDRTRDEVLVSARAVAVAYARWRACGGDTRALDTPLYGALLNLETSCMKEPRTAP